MFSPKFWNDHKDWGQVEILLQDPRIAPSYQNNPIIRFTLTYCYSPIIEELLQDPNFNSTDTHLPVFHRLIKNQKIFRLIILFTAIYVMIETSFNQNQKELII